MLKMSVVPSTYNNLSTISALSLEYSVTELSKGVYQIESTKESLSIKVTCSTAEASVSSSCLESWVISCFGFQCAWFSHNLCIIGRNLGRFSAQTPKVQ